MLLQLLDRLLEHVLQRTPFAGDLPLQIAQMILGIVLDARLEAFQVFEPRFHFSDRARVTQIAQRPPIENFGKLLGKRPNAGFDDGDGLVVGRLRHGGVQPLELHLNLRDSSFELRLLLFHGNLFGHDRARIIHPSCFRLDNKRGRATISFVLPWFTSSAGAR